MISKFSHNPLVSIIVAVYNGENHIKHTLESAVYQTYRNIQIIVIDGNSKDSTVDIVKKLQIEHSSIELLSEPDDGIADAWNKGLIRARGDFIALLNCGDSWPEDFIEINISESSNTYDTIFYGKTHMTLNDQIIETCDGVFNPDRLYNGFSFIHTSIFTSKRVYDLIGPFSIKYKIAIDSDWLLRAYNFNIKFKKINTFNYMSVGGVSSKHWLRAQYEYYLALKYNNIQINISTPQLFSYKLIQYLYLKFNIKKILTHFKLQIIFILLALLNYSFKIIPFKLIRNSLLNLAQINCDATSIVHKGVRFLGFGKLSIGQHTIINKNVLLDNRFSIEIGSNISISHDVRIYTTGHNINSPSFEIKQKCVRIQDYAVLFAGAIIMPGVTIGRGAVVLPFSVVTKDVPPMTVVGGSPAIYKGLRFKDLKYKLEYDYWYAI